MVERLQRDFIYLHYHPAQREVAERIRSGLNRLGRPIWDLNRDCVVDNLNDSFCVAANLASAIVILDSPEMSNPKFQPDVAEVIRRRRKITGIVCVSYQDDGHCRFPATISFTACLSRASSSVIRRLIMRIDEALERIGMLKLWLRGPTGYQRQYILISYASGDEHLANEAHQALSDIRYTIWDYSASPRDPAAGGFGEVVKRIQGAQALIFILTAAWARSKYCQDEADYSREVRVPKYVLRVGPVAAIHDIDCTEVIDCRGGARQMGLMKLRKLLKAHSYPSRQ